MEKSGFELFRELPLGQRVALVGGLIGMVAVPIQVARDQAENRSDISLNPVTWVATPISRALQGAENHIDSQLNSILHDTTPKAENQR